MHLFGLIGYPLSHSFSQKYFTEKFEKEKIHSCRFELFPLASIDELPALINNHPSLAGLSVTIPYKRQVLSFLNNRVGIPDTLNACNCIRIYNKKLFGFNTDIVGFEKSLQPLLFPHHTHALILGSGGASMAVRYVLRKIGITYRLVSRNPHDQTSLSYFQLNKHIIEQHTLIIQTTPLGMYPHIHSCPDIPYEYITPKHLLYDLVYNPAQTLFLQKGKERGATIKNGEEMFILQAEESWKIWKGELNM